MVELWTALQSWPLVALLIPLFILPIVLWQMFKDLGYLFESHMDEE